MRTSYVLGAAASEGARTAGPTIAAMRRTLDDKFPYLAFAVQTRGLPFYEVVLTTDASLLTAAVLADPKLRDQQPEDRFFSSRKASGLIASENEQYSAPSAVLQRFARASAIYYTAIAFADRNLSGAQPAADADALRQGAPFVSIAPGFTGSTLGAILAVPLHRLQTVPFDVPRDRRDSADLAGGEDGYGRAYDADEVEDVDDPGYGLALESIDEDADDLGTAHAYGEGGEYDDGFGTLAYETPEPSYDEAGEGDPNHGEAAAYAYEEEDADDAGAEVHGAAFDSTFDPAESVPEMLQDADHQYDDSGASGDYDDGYGAASALDAMPAAPPVAQARVPFGIPERRHVLETLGKLEGAANPFAIVRQPPDALNVSMFAFGHLGFQLGTGHLGRLLAMMKARHPAKFAEVFGPHADELLKATDVNVLGGGWKAGGQEVYGPYWTARLVESARPDLFGAGQPQLFNGAQNELASELFLEPMLPVARGFDLTTDRSLALLVDIASRSAPGAADWIVSTLGPVQSPAQRQQALSALGFAGLREFQAATPGTERDGAWGPLTHAALVGKLRALGPKSPLPIATGAEYARTLARAASDRTRRTEAIARSSAFTDTAYAI